MPPKHRLRTKLETMEFPSVTQVAISFIFFRHRCHLTSDKANAKKGNGKSDVSMSRIVTIPATRVHSPSANLSP